VKPLRFHRKGADEKKKGRGGDGARAASCPLRLRNPISVRKKRRRNEEGEGCEQRLRQRNSIDLEGQIDAHLDFHRREGKKEGEKAKEGSST